MLALWYNEDNERAESSKRKDNEKWEGTSKL